MPSPSILQQLLDLFPRKGETIKILNPEKVDKLLLSILDGATKSLQVVTDFDMTLTRQHLNGKRCDSSYGVMDRSPLLAEEIKSKNIALCEKYHAIEICHEMSTEEKIPHMIKWYGGTHEILVACGITQSIVKTITQGSNAILRDRAVDFLQTLNEADVPVLIFSAGIGDILHGILQYQKALFPNMKIVSNWMEFDDCGILIGFKEPIIHTFNKNKSVLGTSEKSYFASLSHRENIILLGDSIGDIHMADGMEARGAILKIGFLNMNIEERLESFMRDYDIVIVDDQSMDFLNVLLQMILGDKNSKSTNDDLNAASH